MANLYRGYLQDDSAGNPVWNVFAISASTVSLPVPVMGRNASGKAVFHLKVVTADLTGSVQVEGKNFSAEAGLDWAPIGSPVAIAGANVSVHIPVAKDAAEMRVNINITGGTAGTVTGTWAAGSTGE